MKADRLLVFGLINLLVKTPAQKTLQTLSYFREQCLQVLLRSTTHSTRKKSPGLLTKLIFKAKQEGSGTIAATSALYANDGFGTAVPATGFSVSIAVDETTEATDYVWSDVVPPELFVPSVSKDDSIYGGKYALYFNAIDKDSGIAGYEVREGERKWKAATSPYLLQDQQLHSAITVRATDKAGNAIIATLEAPAGAANHFAQSLMVYLLIFILLSLVFVFRKRIFKVQ